MLYFHLRRRIPTFIIVNLLYHSKEAKCKFIGMDRHFTFFILLDKSKCGGSAYGATNLTNVVRTNQSPKRLPTPTSPVILAAEGATTWTNICCSYVRRAPRTRSGAPGNKSSER